MTRMTLTSTTALVLGLAMSPAMAQNAPFPCGTADGGTVDSAEAFATYLIAQREAGNAVTFDDPALCGPRAGRQAKRAADGALEGLQVPRGNGDDEEAEVVAETTTDGSGAATETDADIEAAEPAAEVAVPEAEVQAEAAEPAQADAPAADPAADAAAEATSDPAAEPATDPAPEPVTDPVVEETAPAAEAAAEPAAEEAADPAAEAAAEPAAPESADPAATAEAAPADAPEAEASDTAEPAPAEETATESDDAQTEMSDADLAAQLEAQAAQEGETEEAPAAEAAPVEEAPAQDEASSEDDANGEGEAAAQTDTTEPAAPAQTEDTAQDGTVETGDQVEADTAADSSEAPAEDAQGSQSAEQAADESTLPPELTPEQRERREARRAERAAARQASAAAQADAAPAETETEQLTEGDVRQATEDFSSRVLSDSAEAAEPDDEGLTNFEKAILLGLGAATVGALLNNGDEVVSNSGDRLIVEREGELRVLKDDNALLRQPGAEVQTQTFDDGSTLTTVTREDGSVVRTVRSADGTVLRRTLVRTDGTDVALIDDLDGASAPVDVSSLPVVSTRSPAASLAGSDEEALRRALTAQLLANTERTYSLEQVRGIQEVRDLAPQVELDTVTFETGSAAIQPSEAEELGALGRAIRDVIAENPGAIFLVEGHTDAVGDAAYNLGLSDRRAETVALALTQYFDVPPENLVTQGYGEQFLKVRTLEAERANRRAAVRNVTGLLRNS